MIVMFCLSVSLVRSCDFLGHNVAVFLHFKVWFAEGTSGK